jgi:hypothetical protein
VAHLQARTTADWETLWQPVVVALMAIDDRCVMAVG